MSEIYPSGDHQVSPNLGLGLWGTDEVTTDNFLLIDGAFASIGGIEVNGILVPPSANFVNSASVTLSVIGSNISLTATGGGGGSSFPARFVTKTSAYVAVAGDFVLCDTSGGGFTVTLPTSAANALANICVKKISSDQNVLTIAASGGNTIDGQSTQMTTQQNTSVLMTATGSTSWEIY